MRTTREWENWQRRMARLPPRRPVPPTTPDESTPEEEDSEMSIVALAPTWENEP